MKIFAAFSAVAVAQDMRMMSSHERLDSVSAQFFSSNWFSIQVSENIEIWIDTYISEHNRVNKFKQQFENLVSYISNKLDMQCAGEKQEEVEELAADGKKVRPNESISFSRCDCRAWRRKWDPQAHEYPQPSSPSAPSWLQSASESAATNQ